ncbi:family 1 glycosylhydrolase [Collinsella sp. An2]|uniref:family 1 glycosylhydrolase n=1 Tax=Collinsella sp. An2 TaxID=1965585 RepID=UPI000B373056|nr:family 1 glycosylhydrolase [Collinsella sp. An2]OUP09724.1 beta-glucosidase [Collinsella sp. An2]
MDDTVFPDRFLWGSATSAHQVEGGNVNSDSWLLEHVEGSAFREASWDAIDHYHRFADDIALLAALGLNAYRFSLEWSRIEPAEGLFSQVAIDHYRDVLACCRAYGLATVVTLHHFTSPIWLLAKNGWESPETPGLFARYVRRVMEELGDLIDMVCTMNEPNLAWTLADVGMAPREASGRAVDPMLCGCARALGTVPEAIAQFQFAATERAFETKLAAHRAAVAAVREVCPDKPVGWTIAASDIVAAPGGEQRAAAAQEELCERFYRASRGDDFIGVQTYSRTWYGPDGPCDPPEGCEMTMQGEEFYPLAVSESIRRAYAVSDCSILVTENGIATEDDAQRVRFYRQAIGGVAACIREGVPVLGYIAWSAFDNFEWVFGYGPKYGIIAVDRATQRRLVKPSALCLGEIARTNGREIVPATDDGMQPGGEVSK